MKTIKAQKPGTTVAIIPIRATPAIALSSIAGGFSLLLSFAAQKKVKAREEDSRY